MPQGIVLSSSSIGAKKEDVERVLAGAGLEIEQDEEVVETPAEPARDDFDSDEAFEEAHVAWKDAQPKEADEEEEDDEEEEVEQKPKAKVSKFKKRISRIVAPIERENAELKRRLDELEKATKKGGKEGEEETPAAEANPRPKRDKFKTDEEYEDALLAWGVAKATAEKAQKDTITQQREMLAANLKTYLAAIEEYRESIDDFDEVVNNEDIPLHPYVQTVIMNPQVVPNPGAVVYYLGKHPEFALKMAAKDIQAQIVEVGRLSDKLLRTESGSAGSATGRRQQQPPKRRAPAPIRPVSTAATSSTLTSAEAAKKGDYKSFKRLQRQGR
jgi:hypothetical protein